MAENSALIPEPTTMYTNKESLKDAKDLSKNLMSGDFERQYNGGESGRKRKGCVILGVTVGALAVWLLVLTIVREIQVTQLRQEVDQLSVNMIAMSANVMSLNQKLSSNRLFNEFKTLEDTIYADEDQEGNVVHDDKDLDKDTQNVESLDKLSGLTVLEDESMLDDDEDMYDGDEDAESGDWYPDYDRRREKVGTTNMVRLKPEDFVDSVSKQDIPKISHLLNENPELTDILPALAASPTSTGDPREKRSLLSTGTTENDFLPTVSKVEERRKIKKFSTTESTKPSTKTVSRTARNSNEQERRPFIAAHFHGNTSHLNTNVHKQYKGNGLLHVSHDAPHNVWYPASWTLASPPASAGTGGRPTLFPSGHVHVRETGIYFVYVQIYYLDNHDVISWVLHRTRGNWDKERDTLLQCSQSAHSNELLDKPNSCFSAAALFLREGDRLAVRNIYGERHSIMQPEKSFIGLIKLADAEEPNYEM